MMKIITILLRNLSKRVKIDVEKYEKAPALDLMQKQND